MEIGLAGGVKGHRCAANIGKQDGDADYGSRAARGRLCDHPGQGLRRYQTRQECSGYIG
jgi:hypothetical protein